MKHLFLLFLSVFFLSSSHPLLEAALPPLWQSAKEITAILNDRQLGDYLSSGEEILDIKKEGSQYRVQGTTSSCKVEVVNLPPTNMGPVPFKLIFHRE